MIPISSDPNQPGTWRFKLFGMPVAVHWFFWLVALLISPVLHVANSPEGFQLLLIWVAVVFVSILVHEFGHAFAFRRYGGRPSVMLWGMGGFATAPGRYTRNQSIVITAAGPGVQLVLAAIFYLLLKTGVAGLPAIACLFMVQVNVFWAVLNLLPIVPLDGGRLLGHFMYEKKPVLRAKIGAVCAVVVGVVIFYYTKSIFNLLIFGYLAYQNYQSANRFNVVR